MLSKNTVVRARVNDVKIPNELTQATLKKSAKGQDVQSFDSIDALFDDLKD